MKENKLVLKASCAANKKIPKDFVFKEYGQGVQLASQKTANLLEPIPGVAFALSPTSWVYCNKTRSTMMFKKLVKDNVDVTSVYSFKPWPKISNGFESVKELLPKKHGQTWFLPLANEDLLVAKAAENCVILKLAWSMDIVDNKDGKEFRPKTLCLVCPGQVLLPGGATHAGINTTLQSHMPNHTRAHTHARTHALANAHAFSHTHTHTHRHTHTNARACIFFSLRLCLAGALVLM